MPTEILGIEKTSLTTKSSFTVNSPSFYDLQAASKHFSSKISLYTEESDLVYFPELRYPQKGAHQPEKTRNK